MRRYSRDSGGSPQRIAALRKKSEIVRRYRLTSSSKLL